MNESNRSRSRLFIGAAVLVGAVIALGFFALVSANNPTPIVISDFPIRQEQGQGYWDKAAKMPIHVSEFSATVLNGKIYVGGGLAGPTTQYTGVTTTFQYYDPTLDRWYTAASLPAPLHHLSLAATSSAIYVTGGYEGDDFTPDVRATWMYRPTLDVWLPAADMPAPRAAHAAVGIGERLYVVGGVGSGSNALWVYDPATNTWDASRPPLPTIREHLTATTVGGKLYVIGGRWSGQGNLHTLEIYDPATNTWTRGRDMPTARGGLTASAVNGLIHVTGGEDLGSSRTFEQHEVYDPTADTWTAYPNLPTPRHGLPSATLGGKWYVIGGGMQAGGGTYTSLSDAVEVFSP